MDKNNTNNKITNNRLMCLSPENEEHMKELKASGYHSEERLASIRKYLYESGNTISECTEDYYDDYF